MIHVLALAALVTVPHPAEAIIANDNRIAAGKSSAGIAQVSLDARWGLWYPDGGGQQGIPMQAFAEAGKPLQIPGPLIRVTAGTDLILHLRNSIPGTVLVVHGIVDRAAYHDHPVTVRFGTVTVVHFHAGAPGTYAYWATTSGRPQSARVGWDSQLGGAIIVDAAGSKSNSHNDRVFVIGNWINVIDPNGVPARRYELLTINGKAWPYTERVSYQQGAVVRWRWVNLSSSPHPMHLHGFFFRVNSRGDGIADVNYGKRGDDALEVTELVPTGGTFAMTWKAERPGDWLIHCHIPFHQAQHVPIAAMLAQNPSVTAREYQNVHLRNAKMGGLVLGIIVNPARSWHRQVQRPERRLRLVVEAAKHDTPTAPAFHYVLMDGAGRLEESDAMGPPIVLTQGVPVAIDVENHLAEPTAVHWHGMELGDSYYDGVGGFSGYADRLAPMIAPGASFAVEFTPPRAGTFIYHTHMHDAWQLRGGLVGPLIVLPRGASFDPATDHVVMITTSALAEDLFNYVLINGERKPPPMVIHAGVPHRFRFINMTTSDPVTIVSLESVLGPVRWRPIAMDGAELPAVRQRSELAVRTITIGKTLDFEFTPTTPGDLTLVVRQGHKPAVIAAYKRDGAGPTLPPVGAVLGTLRIHVI